MHLFGGYRELVVEGAQQSHTSLYPVELWLTGLAPQLPQHSLWNVLL